MRNRFQLTGVFQRTQRGDGFVRPNNPPSGSAPPQDVFIPRKWTSDAATGDVVLVQLHRDAGSRGPRGEIAEILERQTRRFVGTYYEATDAAYVQIDGSLFVQPIYVGDPGAKAARPDDKVVVEMVRFPSPAHEGEGVIVEVLGARGEPGVDTLSIIREFDLPDEFSEDAMEDARRQAEAFDESIPPDRLDLTGQVVVTIDPVDARDFDDAISLTQQADGRWLLGVHIADVSHFVRARSPLDREARDRATSIYLPDRVIPMLPELISNGLASLQSGKVRYTKSLLLEFTAEGTVGAVEFHSAAIRSSKRLTYEEVDAFLADRDRWRRKLDPQVHALLARMHTLAMILRRRRFERGSLELDMPEVKIDLDVSGRVSGAHVVENTESHQIIEEFMLAANEAVAGLLRDRGLPFLRRVHQSPSPLKIKALEEFVQALGLEGSGLRSRFELQKLLASTAPLPQRHAVHYAVLRSMQRAVYSPSEEGHYALASECYCHFTSPIRRYPDLTVHRLLGDLLTRRKPRSDVDELGVLGEHCSDREQRADAAERNLTKLKLLHYLSGRIGEEMDAIVTGVESYGLFAEGIELPASGLIRAEGLVDDFYYFDRTARSLIGRRSGKTYRLGDRLRVAVSRVDLERRELDFRLVERKARRPAEVHQPRPAKPVKAKHGKAGKKKPNQTKKSKRRG